jgi:hypothetical protein
VDGNEADDSAADSGAAYVFVRSGTVWSQQAYLKASNTGAFDNFGYSVAVSGDMVVVGAPFEDSSATGLNGNQADDSVTDSGAAYVFVRGSFELWSQQAYLKASNNEVNVGLPDNFGYSVAVSGDTVVVGAPFEDSIATGVNGDQADYSAEDAGAAYVFVRTLTTWSQQAYLKASNTGAIDFFGYSVAVSGDTVVVGALFEDSNATGVNGNQADDSATDSGAAYVFVRSGGVWSQQAYLKASNTGASDGFGRSVAASGDTVVVGAYLEDCSATGVNGNQADNSAFESGAAYVFLVRSDTTTTTTTLTSSSNPSVFGQPVTFTATVTVSAPGMGTPTGTITFRDGATTIGTGTLNASGVATFSTSALAAGNHQIRATYGGETSFVGGDSPVLTQTILADTDGDGVQDSLDGCPNDANKIAAGICGCGRTDADANANGVADCIDPTIGHCPDNLTLTATSADGIAVDFMLPAGRSPLGATTVTSDPPAGSILPLGTTRVTITARDVHGMTASCTFDVTVLPPEAAPQAAPQELESCAVLSPTFKFPMCGMGCPMALMSAFGALYGMKRSRRRRRRE